MTPYPKSCSTCDSIARVAELMWDFEVSALPVKDRNGTIVGIVTLEGIRFARESSATRCVVVDVMTAVTECCRASDRVSWVERLMHEKHLTHLPVSDDGALVGIVEVEAGERGSLVPALRAAG